MTKTSRPELVYCATCLDQQKRARYRRKNHLRRSVTGQHDVTPEYELRLRQKARRCPICDVRMIDDPQCPDSKELDHIIPLNAGGTHTVGNVRIICRACNLARPWDGSDYVGPVTLWAQDPAVAESVRPASRRGRKPATCLTCGTRIRNGRCWTCAPSRRRLLRRSENADRLAAEMRDAGHGWQAIADELGYGSAGSAYNGVQRWRLSGVRSND